MKIISSFQYKAGGIGNHNNSRVPAIYKTIPDIDKKMNKIQRALLSGIKAQVGKQFQDISVKLFTDNDDYVRAILPWEARGKTITGEDKIIADEDIGIIADINLKKLAETLDKTLNTLGMKAIKVFADKIYGPVIQVKPFKMPK